MELTTSIVAGSSGTWLFMITKIQNLNGTHNTWLNTCERFKVVYDYKDTKFEWNSQHDDTIPGFHLVVYDYKDTKFEWNSQLGVRRTCESIRCL